MQLFRQSITTIIIICLFSSSVSYAARREIPEDNTLQYVALGGIIAYFGWTIYDSYFGRIRKVLPEVVKTAISDVQYIATKKELKALEKITNRDDLMAFMKQFWLRRDPTPGTAINEFKIDHMEKVKIANERYGWGLTPGASTDMGRVYILYGEPFNIIRLVDSRQYFGSASSAMHGFAEAPMIIWEYNFQSTPNSFSTIFDKRGLGRDGTVFVFMDLQKVGDYTQVYSNRSDEYIDSRMIY